tara:strand:- start:2675 stop:3745 length:1071 start_codon:yes stop_codon:yes gene_type:complete
MADITLANPIPNHIPMAEAINTVRKEWVFQWKLLREEWNRAHYMTIAFGLVAFLLGSISSELWSGGDAKLTGIDGVMAISGFQFFQIMVSIICWGWFAYQTLMLFPVMRVHAISLLLMWNGLIGAQIFFHQNNPNFPMGFSLADMMEGTLVLLVVFFFLFFFWKAVVETRDLHVEINHLHEDVRVMEEALADHSLRGWTAMFGAWIALITISAWAGLHHVASVGESNLTFLFLHLLTGLPAVPLLFLVLWYPQRMLGNQTRVRTRAAVDASLEMSVEGQPAKTLKAACPECGGASQVSLNKAGELAHPCLAEGCSALTVVGTNCLSCSEPMPKRIACPSCGVNAPALDYMPDQEAW